MKGLKDLWKSWKTCCPGWLEPGQPKCFQDGSKPLALADPGKKFRVCRIIGGRGACARLAHMGIYPGVEMELVCGGCDAPCIVKVHDVVISLGKGISQKIMVEEA
jgi:ferrous iron transport protein A